MAWIIGFVAAYVGCAADGDCALLHDRDELDRGAVARPGAEQDRSREDGAARHILCVLHGEARQGSLGVVESDEAARGRRSSTRAR